MDPIKSLAEDHAVISRALEALDGYLRRVAEGAPAEPAELGRFATFFSQFADLNHHEKEEDLFLPALQGAGLAWESTTLQSVRSDHRQERYLVRELNDSWPREGDWTAENRRHVDSIGQAYVEFQRRHIALEEEELMPLAKRLLDDKQLVELGKRFVDFLEYFGKERYDKLVECANALHAKYGDSTPETLR